MNQDTHRERLEDEEIEVKEYKIKVTIEINGQSLFRDLTYTPDFDDSLYFTSANIADRVSDSAGDIVNTLIDNLPAEVINEL